MDRSKKVYSREGIWLLLGKADSEDGEHAGGQTRGAVKERGEVVDSGGVKVPIVDQTAQRHHDGGVGWKRQKGRGMLAPRRFGPNRWRQSLLSVQISGQYDSSSPKERRTKRK